MGEVRKVPKKCHPGPILTFYKWFICIVFTTLTNKVFEYELQCSKRMCNGMFQSSTPMAPIRYLSVLKQSFKFQANVVCKQLGYPNATNYTTGSYFGIVTPRCNKIDSSFCQLLIYSIADM